jgi:competence protein ComEC
VAQVSGIEPRPVDAGGFAVHRPSRRSLLEALTLQLEVEHDRWFLWLPVLFGGGVALYFMLPSEPELMIALLPAVAVLALHLAGPSTGLAGLVTAALLTATLGLAAAKLRTEAVRAPVLERQVGPIDVYGFIELVEPRATKG